ncbi:hypothetical protein D3C83_127030 [compost metagenome]
MGVPGKVVRQLGEEQIAQLRESAVRYVANFKRFKRGLTAQTQADPFRPGPASR